jgi:hypothetical protein
MTATVIKTSSQFDNKYKTDEFGNNRNACSLFSIYLAASFLSSNSFELPPTYETILAKAIKNLNLLAMNKFPTFEELLVLTTNYTDDNIQGTSAEIISKFGYNEIIPVTKTKFVSICLKNSTYLTILFDCKNYYLVNCHVTEQYCFNTRDALIQHLNNTYSFNKKMVVDGVEIDEFSNIEYCVFKSPILFRDGMLLGSFISEKNSAVKTTMPKQINAYLDTFFGFSSVSLTNKSEVYSNVQKPIVKKPTKTFSTVEDKECREFFEMEVKVVN